MGWVNVQEKKMQSEEFIVDVTEECQQMFPNLAQYHNDVAFLQMQLVLGLSLVVKHDLAAFCHWRDAEISSVVSLSKCNLRGKGGARNNVFK